MLHALAALLAVSCGAAALGVLLFGAVLWLLPCRHAPSTDPTPDGPAPGVTEP